jgi:hypothetical protein
MGEYANIYGTDGLKIKKCTSGLYGDVVNLRRYSMEDTLSKCYIA